jgi:hypothetical protein
MIAMAKPNVTEEPAAAAAQDEDENFDLVEHLRMARARRAYEKLLAIRGKIHLNLDIDELRGRNRR